MINKFIEKVGLELKAERIEKRENSWDGFHWLLTLSRAGTKETLSFEFTTGGALLEVAEKPTVLSSYATYRDKKLAADNIKSIYFDFKLNKFRRYCGPMTLDLERSCQTWLKPKTPSLPDVVSCLQTDCEVLNFRGFEDWADAFGYDTDSRQAERTYNLCLNTALKARYFFGKFFEELEKLRED